MPAAIAPAKGVTSSGATARPAGPVQSGRILAIPSTPSRADPPAFGLPAAFPAPSPRLAVDRIGCLAAAALSDAAARKGWAPVEVIAVFRRSLYLRLPGALVCLGDAGIGDGPLHLVCHDALPDALSALSPGACGRLLPGRLALPGLQLSSERATIWTPPPLPVHDARRAAAAATLLAAMLPPELPQGGLSGLIRSASPASNPVERAAMPALAALARWAARAAETGSAVEPPPRRAITALLGLGPGLTPSGDDALAGFLVGLAILGATDARDRLMRAVMTQAPQATNEISLAHLEAAGLGYLCADLHRVIGVALAADRPALAEALADLGRAGHNSPWDALAGLSAALRSHIS